MLEKEILIQSIIIGTDLDNTESYSFSSFYWQCLFWLSCRLMKQWDYKDGEMGFLIVTHQNQEMCASHVNY